MSATWLVGEGRRRLTPNRYPAGSDDVEELAVVVLHYTAGYGASGSLEWLCNPASDASAHFLIDRNGTVYQLAPLEDRTWHAGGKTSRWRELPVNPRSIGVELCNLGPITDGKDARGREFTGQAVEVDGRGAWEAWPEEQLAALEGVLGQLAKRYPALRVERWPDDPALAPVCGHEHVDPTRKKDPGPAFPWDRIKKIFTVGITNTPPCAM